MNYLFICLTSLEELVTILTLLRELVIVIVNTKLANAYYSTIFIFCLKFLIITDSITSRKKQAIANRKFFLV